MAHRRPWSRTSRTRVGRGRRRTGFDRARPIVWKGEPGENDGGPGRRGLGNAASRRSAGSPDARGAEALPVRISGVVRRFEVNSRRTGSFTVVTEAVVTLTVTVESPVRPAMRKTVTSSTSLFGFPPTPDDLRTAAAVHGQHRRGGDRPNIAGGQGRLSVVVSLTIAHHLAGRPGRGVEISTAGDCAPPVPLARFLLPWHRAFGRGWTSGRAAGLRAAPRRRAPLLCRCRTRVDFPRGERSRTNSTPRRACPGRGLLAEFLERGSPRWRRSPDAPGLVRNAGPERSSVDLPGGVFPAPSRRWTGPSSPAPPSRSISNNWGRRASRIAA